MPTNNNTAMQKRLIAGMKKKAQKPPNAKSGLPLPKAGGGGVGALDHLVQRRVLDGGGGGGTNNYNNLQNIPQISGVPLKGNMTLQDIGVKELSNAEIQTMFDEIIEGA